MTFFCTGSMMLTFFLAPLAWKRSIFFSPLPPLAPPPLLSRPPPHLHPSRKRADTFFLFYSPPPFPPRANDRGLFCHMSPLLSLPFPSFYSQMSMCPFFPPDKWVLPPFSLVRMFSPLFPQTRCNFFFSLYCLGTTTPFSRSGSSTYLSLASHPFPLAD